MDGVFTHFPHLENNDDVFAADVECHKDCIKSCLGKYDRKSKNNLFLFQKKQLVMKMKSQMR